MFSSPGQVSLSFVYRAGSMVVGCTSDETIQLTHSFLRETCTAHAEQAQALGFLPWLFLTGALVSSKWPSKQHLSSSHAKGLRCVNRKEWFLQGRSESRGAYARKVTKCLVLPFLHVSAGDTRNQSTNCTI